MSVAIVGVAESDLGVTGRSILHLQAQAVTGALRDAGLTLAEIDGLATAGASRFSAAQVAEYLGIQPAWTDSTFAGGSAFEMYVARAVQAIEAGQCTTVLVSYGSNQRSARSRSLGGVVEEHTPQAEFEAPYGALYPVSYYAMAAQRYLHERGAGREDLAEVAVAAREWALLNPKAYRHRAGPLTVEEVLAQPMISSPLTAADCCLVTDGGAALVLTTLERARDLRTDPVVVLGYGESTTHDGMAAPANLLRTGTIDAGRRAFARAGLGPADVDVAQLYDSFTITVLLTLEGLGLCGPGEAGDLVRSRRLPFNTTGGGLSYCHPGMYGLLLLVEAVRQVRGECGPRQVPGVEVALAHGVGGILSTHATVLLGADR
ncbi:acetyl-CoA acetyltransferase [Nonomuraea thailandensis]|uniref:Acetyl-CoA acetyltransferase n=1 Tax=Nonomuraea thailandensis TaxID=1188745 RepID=A0A9X2GHA6_9ACTN|nr:acetyl-CoA acetyltransferase [Nonomuraea thailandensis]MCP2357499.1 acetyl-CoA acetyltransferase [Nonomuraea thailandensis]